MTTQILIKSWVLQSNLQHRQHTQILQKCKTKTELKKKEREFGCRYSSLLELPYFDPVRMTIIDPMKTSILVLLSICFKNLDETRAAE